MPRTRGDSTGATLSPAPPRRRIRRRVLLRASLLAGLAWRAALAAPDAAHLDAIRPGAGEPAATAPALGATPCVGGSAGGYPCSGIDLLALLPLSEFTDGSDPSFIANDLWGWTDPESGREFALLGVRDGTAFVEITDPSSPVYLGKLPTHTASSDWRDVKVHDGHAFVVSEAAGHGLQVFHLEDLLDVASPPVTFSETGHYDGFGPAHNIVVDEATGYGYAVGTGSDTHACGSGLHIVDLSIPDVPTYAGCYTVSPAPYTHDAQCVLYAGPDTEHAGDEICFASNASKLKIVDVTDKGSPQLLASVTYPGLGYVHQGWLTDDHAFFLLDDELDEVNDGIPTRTYVWDVSNLEEPSLVGYHSATTAAIDHNLYIDGPWVYQANYRAGLRILHLDDPATAALTEAAYFDVDPSSDAAGYHGAWSVYPYFPSGNLIVSSIEQGLFVLRPTGLCETPDPPDSPAATGNGDHRIDVDWTGSGAAGNLFRVERATGGCGGAFAGVTADLGTESFADESVSGGVTYGYRVRETDATGTCVSMPSACVEAATTGACNAPPAFAGLDSATADAASNCRVRLDWTAGSSFCGGETTCSVYRSSDPGFTPGPANRIAEGLTTSGWIDLGATPLEPAHYVVRAADATSGAEESNLVVRSATPRGPDVDGTFAAGAEAGDPPVSGFAAGDALFFHQGWQVSDLYQRSGDRSYWSTAVDSACDALELGPVELTPATAPELAFWTLWDLEDGYDGGVVELSDDDGSTWTRLGGGGFYPGTMVHSNDACGLAPGTPAFTGEGALSTWSERAVDLTKWAGERVRLRWLVSTDESVHAQGWYVDDVAVSHAQVPGACTSNGIFVSGFELGGLAEWSGTGD